MLSAQCYELRAVAESVGLAVPQAATLMMEAADTIDRLDLALDSKRIAERRVTELLDDNANLREQGARLFDKTLELRTENAKLREKLAASPQCETCEAMLDCDECLRADESAKERKRLDYENTKLREKARELWHGHDCGGGCVYFERCDHPIKDECPMIDSLRELGIEV